MKKATTIILAMASLAISAQQLNVSITKNCNYYCAPGTWKLDTAYCAQYFLMTANGASNYTWTINNNLAATTPTLLFSITHAGAFICTVTGTAIINQKPAYATATTTIYVQNCQFGSPVGITEYELNELTPTYYNLQGQPIDKAYNTLLIEQRGRVRKKVYLQD